jgi:hypothetical protein
MKQTAPVIETGDAQEITKTKSGDEGRPLAARLERDPSRLLGFVPVDCLGLAFLRDTRQRDESHAGDHRHRLAGRSGYGAVQFVLGHRFFSWNE